MRTLAKDPSQAHLLASGGLLTIFDVPWLLDTSPQSLTSYFQGLPPMHLSRFPLFPLLSHIESEAHYSNIT